MCIMYIYIRRRVKSKHFNPAVKFTLQPYIHYFLSVWKAIKVISRDTKKQYHDITLLQINFRVNV